MAADVPGTEGYVQRAEALIEQWAAIPLALQLEPFLGLVPEAPSDILDIGAGSGAIALGLTAMGHRVVAVEPVDAFRAAARRLDPDASVTWIDDSLPKLARVCPSGDGFDLVLAIAMWMHLDAHERVIAMRSVARLLRPGAVVVISLRHGPVPVGRRMYDVTGDETIAIGRAAGLDCILYRDAPSIQASNQASGVSWSWLAFRKPRIQSQGCGPS